MQRHFINLAYLGAPFHGWQTQPNAVSVQQCLEEALSTLQRRRVEVVGAGRTDAGVNASMMIAHADLNDTVTDDTQLVRALNSLLGPHIAVRWVHPVHATAHARFDAVARTYRYFAHVGRNPFVQGLSWQAPPTLDFEAMNRAARQLLEVSDFTSFAKLHTDVKTNICHVTKAEWQRLDGAEAAFPGVRDNSRPLSPQHGAGRGRNACRCGARQTYGGRIRRCHSTPRPVCRRHVDARFAIVPAPH